MKRQIDYLIIQRFTLKEKIKILLGINNRDNFECWYNSRKFKVHLKGNTSQGFPFGYVELLKGEKYK